MEHLEWEESGSQDVQGVASMHQQLKISILKLLVFCVDNPSPNIAHLLLGFNSGKKLTNTTLQDPGQSH